MVHDAGFVVGCTQCVVKFYLLADMDLSASGRNLLCFLVPGFCHTTRARLRVALGNMPLYNGVNGFESGEVADTALMQHQESGEKQWNLL